MEKMVWIHKNVEDLNNAASTNIANILIQAVHFRGTANIAISGGSSPIGVYQALAQNQCRSSVPWNEVHFFWGDERCVPPESLESNYRQAVDNLLRNIPVSPEKIHRIKGEFSPQEAVSDYIHVLSDHAQGKNPWPAFDIALMGMGEDGHTASLFPGIVNPEENVNPVIEVTARYQERPSTRVTLTPMVFNSSRNVIFLAIGDSKARALQVALEAPADPINIPVQRIQPTQGNIIWHVDSDAVKLLKEGKKQDE